MATRPVVFLERKLREPDGPGQAPDRGAADGLDRLTNRVRRDSWSGDWFQARLAARRLRPVCQVSYRRTARSEPAAVVSSGSRWTKALVARSHRGGSRFRDEPRRSAIDGRQILELKFRYGTPAIFKRLVEEFALTPEPASKYRLGMAATRPGAADGPQLRPRQIDAADADAVHV